MAPNFMSRSSSAQLVCDEAGILTDLVVSIIEEILVEHVIHRLADAIARQIAAIAPERWPALSPGVPLDDSELPLDVIEI